MKTKFGGHVSHCNSDLQCKFEILNPSIWGVMTPTPINVQKKTKRGDKLVPVCPTMGLP